jgi:hypothetical protein
MDGIDSEVWRQSLRVSLTRRDIISPRPRHPPHNFYRASKEDHRSDTDTAATAVSISGCLAVSKYPQPRNVRRAGQTEVVP